jgi:hypothetical protein
MTKRTLLLLLAAVGLAGCTPTYRVHVNAFSQLKEPLTRGEAIYVVVDPNSRNPILADKIAAKIRMMLQDLGYVAAEKRETAPHTLTFHAGVDRSAYVDYLPVSRPWGGYYGFRGGFHRGFGFGYTAYEPFLETVYSNWLDMRLFGPAKAAKTNTQPLWIGEAVVGTDEPELRQAVDYLLVGLMEYFAEDTQHWVTVPIQKNDPRAEGLAAMP